LFALLGGGGGGEGRRGHQSPCPTGNGILLQRPEKDYPILSV